MSTQPNPLTGSWLPVILTAIPELPAILAAIGALFRKYPALSKEEVMAAITATVTVSDEAFDRVIARADAAATAAAKV